MVSPFLDMPIRGFLWYQGCSNVGRATQYESLFQTLILDWKERFNRHAKVAPYPRSASQQGGRSNFRNLELSNSSLPFYFVQIANYLARKDIQPDSEWAAIREAQRKALQLDGVGMAVNIDIGEANDIHPRNKNGEFRTKENSNLRLVRQAAESRAREWHLHQGWQEIREVTNSAISFQTSAISFLFSRISFRCSTFSIFCCIYEKRRKHLRLFVF